MFVITSRDLELTRSNRVTARFMLSPVAGKWNEQITVSGWVLPGERLVTDMDVVVRVVAKRSEPQDTAQPETDAVLGEFRLLVQQPTVVEKLVNTPATRDKIVRYDFHGEVQARAGLYSIYLRSQNPEELLWKLSISEVRRKSSRQVETEAAWSNFKQGDFDALAESAVMLLVSLTPEEVDDWLVPEETAVSAKHVLDQAHSQKDRTIAIDNLESLRKRFIEARYIAAIGLTSPEIFYLGKNIDFEIVNHGTGSRHICRLARMPSVSQLSKEFKRPHRQANIHDQTRPIPDKFVTDAPTEPDTRVDFISHRIESKALYQEDLKLIAELPMRNLRNVVD